jgi:hypothetical protein
MLDRATNSDLLLFILIQKAKKISSVAFQPQTPTKVQRKLFQPRTVTSEVACPAFPHSENKNFTTQKFFDF